MSTDLRYLALTALLTADWYLRTNRILVLLCYAIASLASLLSHEIGILTLPMILHNWLRAMVTPTTSRRNVRTVE